MARPPGPVVQSPGPGDPHAVLSRFNRSFIQIVHRLWFRASLFAMFGVVSARAAPLIAPFVPGGWSEVIDRQALNNILEIIASSMLIVAPFSLSTMVAAGAREQSALAFARAREALALREEIERLQALAPAEAGA